MLNLLSVVALASVAAAGPAWANESVEVVKAKVSHSDLDLNDPADIAELQKRIDRKARQICTAGYNSELRTRSDIQACRASVRESAKSLIDCAHEVAVRQGKARRS
jgi:UrcA family protein